MRIFIICLFLALNWACSSEKNTANQPLPQPKKTIKPEPILEERFVFANSGLNVRSRATLQSEAIGRLPLNSKVTVYLDSVGSEALYVEGLKGKMVKVKGEPYSGYVFSGYLAPYPIAKRTDLWSYANALQLEGFEPGFTQWESAQSDSSFQELNQAILFPDENSREAWQSYYLIAQELGFMKHDQYVFAFPGKERKGVLVNQKDQYRFAHQAKEQDDDGHWVEKYTINPSNDILWVIEVTITRDQSDELVTISEFTRTEGSGQTITLSYEEGQFKLAKNAYAD